MGPRRVSLRRLTCAAGLGAALLAAVARGEGTPCPEHGLAARGSIALPAPPGGPSAADGRFAAEGSTPSPAGSATLAPGADLTLDLGEARPVGFLAFEVDSPDAYQVLASADGVEWLDLGWSRPQAESRGLRLRFVQLPQPLPLRFVRLRASAGRRAHAVVELAAYCARPAWLGRLVAPPEGELLHRLEAERRRAAAGLGKLALLLAAAAALALAGRARSGRPQTRAARLLPALLGGLAVLAWPGFFAGGRYLHGHELFHHYLGARYAPELGYLRLYECAAIADAQDGFQPFVDLSRYRDLGTNQVRSGSELVSSPGRCLDHFTAERWAQFKEDVALLRTVVPPDEWGQLLLDHGFNASPAWTLVAAPFATALPPGRAALLLLTGLDVALLLVAGALVWRGFGALAACAAAVWWGTNELGSHEWIGGAFLRHDWLVACVLAAFFARRRWPFWCGAALAYASASRLFPALLLAGPLAQAAWQCWRARGLRVSPALRRLAAGYGAGLALLVLLSGAALGPGAWRDFGGNLVKHARTPSTNLVGLPTLLAFDPAHRALAPAAEVLADRFEPWKDARQRTYAGRRAGHWALALAFLALLARAVRGRPLWVALVLSVGVIPVVTELSCYYYALFLLYGLLVPRRARWVGPALCGLAAASLLSARIFDVDLEATYLVDSAAVVAFGVFAVLASGRPRPEALRGAR